MAAGYRSRVTGGAGGISLSAAGEQDTHVGEEDWLRSVVPDIVVSYIIIDMLELSPSIEATVRVERTDIPTGFFLI